jgi:hypothetical protein
MWFCRSEFLVWSHILASHQARSRLNGTHPINRFLIKLKKVIRTKVLVLLCYPDFNDPALFHLYTDASDHQLGAVIIQGKNPIAFYSQNLNTSQKRYTTNERDRELLSDIETCKEYKNILLRYPTIVFTGHKNNNFNGLKSSYRVLRTSWLLLLEEYGVTFEYLPGKIQKNVDTNALSYLDIDSLNIQEE